MGKTYKDNPDEFNRDRKRDRTGWKAARQEARRNKATRRRFESVAVRGAYVSDDWSDMADE